MISVNNISVSFGGQELFNEVSFMVNHGDRIGLVGRNGAGKSTLLKLLAGEHPSMAGSISTPNEVTIGYLKQDIEFAEGRTVKEEAETAFKELKVIETRRKAVTQKMEERTDYESEDYLNLITEFNELEERFGLLGGHSIESDISLVLKGLGFLDSDFNRPTREFSGGWRMRIELAKILLEKPDVLLLDEPTNHLDLESIIWLESWLSRYPGSLLLVSHDRIFLDTVTNRTIEIILGKANDYKASYSKYLQLRRERQEKQEQAKRNQDKHIQHSKELINKFRYKKNKAAFAQTLIRKLGKLERIQVEQDDLSSMHFRFSTAPHSGKVAVLASGIGKQYDELEVLKDINLEIERGQKIAFVGKNGEGKTTLAKIMVNQLEHEGKLELGHKVKVGYYAQNQAELLDGNKTVLKTIEDATNEETFKRVRDILGSFLFSGDTVEKKVKVLSGGERARVALCKLLMEPVNLLVMDEPTNHLDILSREILKKALKQYDGALIIVSHDREFLQGLTEKVYEFRDKGIKEYYGDINDFLSQRELSDFKALELSSLEKSKSAVLKSPSANKLAYQERKKREKDLKRANNRLKKLEKEVDELEKNLKNLDEQLSDPMRFKELSQEKGFFDGYEQKQTDLKNLMKDWETAQTVLDSLTAKMD